MPQPAQVDPRGQRFNAGITAVVLTGGILTLGPAPRVATALIAFQRVIFLIGGFYRLPASPYSWLYRHLVAPRIGPPTELESSAGPAFSQQVGGAFLFVTLVAVLLGATAVVYAALALALVMALLNAGIGLCLGCELYLLLQRAKIAR